MPNGSTHTRATFAITAALTIGAVYAVVRYGHHEALAVPVGALAGLLLSPDLDVDGGSISNHHARSIGGVFGLAWSLYWMPYALMMPHRGRFSHAPILGTLVRLVYASLWLIPVVIYFRLELPWLWIGAAAVGLCVSDTVHAGMDWIL